MKRRIVFITFTACLLTAVRGLEARINLFDPWFPGQDSGIAGPRSYQRTASMETGEYFCSFPFQMTYAMAPNTEVGGRWGLRASKYNIGISDLMLGVKYRFMEETELQPAVIGEAAVSLPTGNSVMGLGTGSTDLLLHWALEKKMERMTGYFGLGLRINSENSSHVQEGNVFSYHIGASMPYEKDVTLYGELKGFNHGWTKADGVNISDTYQELYLAPGIAYFWKARKKTISAAVLLGLTPESHDLGIMVSSAF